MSNKKKNKIMVRIFALVLAVLMVLGVSITLIFALLNR